MQFFLFHLLKLLADWFFCYFEVIGLIIGLVIGRAVLLASKVAASILE